MARTARAVVLAASFTIFIIAVSICAVLLGEMGKQSLPESPINVACVGDSITEWSAYTDNLQVMLGADYSVGNFGVAGATVSKTTSKPYVSQTAYQESKAFQPDVVIIMLGTNDAHTYQTAERFAMDYADLISEYQSLDNEPTILLVKPPPIYPNSLELSDENLENNVVPSIEQVAQDLNLSTVDVNSALQNHPEYFEDGVHPNNDGALAIASEIFESIDFEIAQGVYPP